MLATNNIKDNPLSSIFDNNMLSYVVSNFATLEECLSLKDAIYKEGFEEYIDVDPPIGRLGITQFESKKHGKHWYFEQAAIRKKCQEKIFSSSFNPLYRLKNFLKNYYKKVDFAREYNLTPGYNPEYYYGLVRQINNAALIHADFGPYDGRDWEIGKIKSQIAWNLCISKPSFAGNCIVYDKLWDYEKDERYRISSSYGYEPKIVSDCKSETISLDVGQSYFFNSRNFHEVQECQGTRITISCFIGLTDDESLILWS